MELKEQMEVVENEVRKALITALEQKDDIKAKKLFTILSDVRSVIPYRYEPSTFSITSNPDIISFGGTDSGICLG